MSESRDTSHPNSAPTPSPETQRLGALVGRWRSEGHIVGDPPVAITGTDIYEWLPGGFFLVHHVDVMIGKQPVQALELIGEYDAATDAFLARAYDNLGNITLMRAKVDDQGVWTFTGGGDVAPVAQPLYAEGGGAVRSTLTISPDRSGMTARWERSEDGASWQPWMDMTFTRMPQLAWLLKGPPVVDGEVIWEEPEGYYHHYPAMEQVWAWLGETAFVIVEEAEGPWRAEEYAYHQVLARLAAPPG